MCFKRHYRFALCSHSEWSLSQCQAQLQRNLLKEPTEPTTDPRYPPLPLSCLVVREDLATEDNPVMLYGECSACRRAGQGWREEEAVVDSEEEGDGEGEREDVVMGGMGGMGGAGRGGGAAGFAAGMSGGGMGGFGGFAGAGGRAAGNMKRKSNSAAAGAFAVDHRGGGSAIAESIEAGGERPAKRFKSFGEAMQSFGSRGSSARGRARARQQEAAKAAAAEKEGKEREPVPYPWNIRKSPSHSPDMMAKEWIEAP
ncbi:hypothetical protein B0T20DRAFT_485353 [Sordaria brevicollis]|uniref:Uncharacterized protein n=1 Tax=Sordaria brevicollis TaxID=83679 RepID=A0AAE0PMV1_SORBR|nr:hypothetical protein B0T20DRAFT_485353 [Sordaria brevicollis]